MHTRRQQLTLALALVIAAGCDNVERPLGPRATASSPQFTTGSGTTGTPLGQATFDGGKIKRITDKWHFEINSHKGFDMAVRMFSYDVDAQTGWHRHPGPVLIQVVVGEVTFYEGDDPTCTGRVVRAGESYIDAGDHAHIGRNESGAPAQDLVVLFGPPGLPPSNFRIDAPDPGNCNF